MDPDHASTRLSVHLPAETEHRTNMRLTGPWLRLALVGWIALVLYDLTVLVVSTPAYYAQLHVICTDPTGKICLLGQPTVGNMQAIHYLGLSLDTYAIYTITLSIVASLIFLSVGAVIFWRKFAEWMGLYVSLILITFGSIGNEGVRIDALSTVPASWAMTLSLIGGIVTAAIYPAIGIFLYFFPDGRFVPRWAWVLVLLWLIQAALYLFLPIDLFPMPWGLLLFVVMALSTYGSSVSVQIYRYLRTSDPGQRQQTKWLVFGFAVAFLFILLYNLGALIPTFGQPDSLYQLANTTVTFMFLTAVPLALGIAILRYRLWDIDLIINRTLVYGTLTAMLALIYVALVIALQSLLRILTGEAAQQPLVIVASTLVIAALFQPLRRGIQGIIDRRFYRRKYDAARTLVAFSAMLRNEVDINTLNDQLVAVVQETMQPTHVFLWLHTPERAGKPQMVWNGQPATSSQEE